MLFHAITRGATQKALLIVAPWECRRLTGLSNMCTTSIVSTYPIHLGPAGARFGMALTSKLPTLMSVPRCLSSKSLPPSVAALRWPRRRFSSRFIRACVFRMLRECCASSERLLAILPRLLHWRNRASLTYYRRQRGNGQTSEHELPTWRDLLAA